MNRKNFIPTLEQLESRTLLSGIPSLADLASNAMTMDVAVNGSMTANGILETPTETNVYQFTAQASGRCLLEMGADGGGLDSFLELYSSTGRKIRTNDNATRYTKNSAILLNVRPGQSFYAVTRATRKTSGAYTFKVTNKPTDDCGNTFQDARRIRLAAKGATSLLGTINYYDDADMLSFAAPTSGTMKINLAPYRSYLWGELTAYDSQGRQLAAATDAGGYGTSVSFDVAAGSTYYLGVGGASSVGRYLLNFSTQKKTINPTNPNNPLPPSNDQAAPSPLQTLSAYIDSSSGLNRLMIVGTDSADTICVSQTGGTITMTSSAGQTSFDGVQSVYVYGFGGNDAIRFTNAMAVGAVVYAGAGDDSVFDAGQGSDRIYGGEGNDLIVSIGGGTDEIRGEGGLDSIWTDTSDTVADASSAENAVGAIHRVGTFYQPAGSSVSLEIAGQNLVDPSTSYGYRNFASAPIFVDGPQYNDIRQGAVGDCYFVASLAALADTDPEIIRQLVAPLGDGTCAVRFYRGGTSVFVRIDADLPTYSGGSLAYAKLTASGETWVAMVEKAYAFFRYGENSYSSLNWGWMADPTEEITNVATSMTWTTDMTAASLFSYIQGSLANGHAMTIGSKSTAFGPIVGSHAYMIKSAQVVNGTSYVTVYNPWGYDGRNYDSNTSDGLVTLTIQELQNQFTALVASMA